MILTEAQRKEFEEAARPMMQFLNEYCHPHATVVINGTHAELLEGVCGFTTMDYVKD